MLPAWKSRSDNTSDSEIDTVGDISEKGELLPKSTGDNASLRQQWLNRSRIIHIGIISLELLLCVFLIVGYVFLNKARQSAQHHHHHDYSLDGLSHLGTYNTTMRFHNQSELLRDSHEANTYWRDLLGTAGVVSLNTQWAKQQGLRPSAMSPTDSSQSIYQVDVFHALHCLNSIRQNLVPENKPEWNEKHMLHCLDYVRHQLLCHPDLTLVTTDDLDEFVLTETHQCRDYGAMLEWVDRHRWVEFPDWLKNKTSKEH